MSDKKTHDFNRSRGQYDQLNALQTNRFENEFAAHKMGVNFQSQTGNCKIQFGGAVQKSELTSKSISLIASKDFAAKKQFISFLPSASFNYSLKRAKNLRINYRGRTLPPSISTLQPVPDYSNPLQVREGNPTLKQEFNNNIVVNYTGFNITNFNFMLANIIINNTSNKIVNSIDTLRNFSAQLIRPVNMSGHFNILSYVIFGMPLRGKLKGSSFNVNASIAYNHDVSMLNKRKNHTNSLVVGQIVSTYFDFNDKVNITLSTGLVYNKIENPLNSHFNEEYFSQTFSSDINYTFPENIVLGTEVDYYRNSGRGEGYNQNIFLLNSSISKLIFNRKTGELKLSVNDILNQNQNINRIAGENYIEDIRTTQLKRYFLFSFIYYLRPTGNSQTTTPALPTRMQRQNDKLRISH